MSQLISVSTKPNIFHFYMLWIQPKLQSKSRIYVWSVECAFHDKHIQKTKVQILKIKFYMGLICFIYQFLGKNTNLHNNRGVPLESTIHWFFNKRLYSLFNVIVPFLNFFAHSFTRKNEFFRKKKCNDNSNNLFEE